MKYRWVFAKSDPCRNQQLARELNISPLMAQCLWNRGLLDMAAMGVFLEPRLKRLSDPFLLPEMGLAVERLVQARREGERVVIFGDYDVDGVTSTALLLEVLKALGWRAEAYLPHRLEEGYGLSQDGVEKCFEKFPAKLLLAVDCGSTAVETIRWLGEKGVDVVVLDHHQISSPRPAAKALVNPHLAQPEEISFRELCSAGLAFKLAHALVKTGRQLGWPAAQEYDLRPLLDLVALGTVADLVPLQGENRILVAQGLEYLNRTRRPGLVALKEVAQVREGIGVYEIGFQLAPRLNAAGRLENAWKALELILAASDEEAGPLAEELNAQNRERQQIERSIVDEVIGAVRARISPDCYVIVEGRLLWHIGVVGIVASRVMREFHRPTVIIGGEGRQWRGSGRSIEGFDLAAALRGCDDLLVRHGGHAMAAGLTIVPENIEELRERLNSLARSRLQPDQLKPSLRIDAEVELGEMDLGQMDELSRLQPHGQGNPPVQLAVRNLKNERPPQRMGKEQQHARLRLTDGTACSEAVWWNAVEEGMPQGMFDAVLAPEINEYGGRRSVRFKLLDWRVRGGSEE
jgi:single-stranded-DNA-specific exonuclease